MGKVTLLALILACMATAVCLEPTEVRTEQIQLSTILPKLQAIYEDSNTLSIKNSELKSKILAGLQAQNEAKLRLQKESRTMIVNEQPPGQSTTSAGTATESPPQAQGDKNGAINYAELEEFNKWVEMSLDYAVKNVQATIDALKEEASLNHGNVDYSEQAVKDGIEGVKYWRLAVLFQDKTLMGEQFDIE